MAKTLRYPIAPRALRVRDVPARQRPRELFDRVGAGAVPDDVLVAILLRSGVHGMSVIELARGLVLHYGSLSALAQASIDELAEFPGIGRVKAQVLKAAFELARRVAEESTPETPAIRTPADVASVLRETARVRDQETFWVLPLDAKNRLKRPPFEITRGLLDASLVHPREVFKEAIRCACAAIVLAHNHPSGDPQPSAEDVRVTRQIVQAGEVVNIAVLDHVILGRQRAPGSSDFFSLREAGLVAFSS